MTAPSPKTGPAKAPVPQPVLTPLTSTAIFLVMTMEEGAETTVRDLLADLSGLQRTVGFRVPEGRLAVVAGIGSSAWDRLYGAPRPKELHPFREVNGAKHRAVSTPGDLLFHVRAGAMDLCFELGSQIMDRLNGSVTVVDEVHGFKYFEIRDLLGFVDGTENPIEAAAAEAVTVGADDPGFAGASYVIVQRYMHDLPAWNALPVEMQERAIGRTKLSNVELSDDLKPTDSHVALTTIVAPDGTERQILRDNMPFGTLGSAEFGTYFIGYSSTPSVTEEMLENMFLGKPLGNYDRILDVSRAVTGTLFFVPTIDFLEDPPPIVKAQPHSANRPLAGSDISAAGGGRPVEPSADLVAANDNSLGIGGMKVR